MRLAGDSRRVPSPPGRGAEAPGEDQPDALLPLLAGKTAGGEVTTYICENFTCAAPLVGAAAVEEALRTQV